MLDRIRSIARKVLNNDKLELRLEQTPGDIDGWDSLHHVMIIAEIEKQFHISFDFMELLEIKTIGDLCDAIKRKS